MQNRLISNFASQGIFIFKVENENFLAQLVGQTLSCFNKVDQLSKIHEEYDATNINECRLSAFRQLNTIKDWEKNYFSLASEKIKELIGPDILIQNKLNLSVQMPNDESSQLGLHTDILSGESEFEIVLWVPLTDTKETNSMYIFDLETSQQIYSQMPKFEKLGMSCLFDEFSKKAHFLELKKGEALIFSPTLFHGNVINQTAKTRVSINCRFKSLFSPQFEEFPTERKAGPFYKLLDVSPVTEFGLLHNDKGVSFTK